jgi:hypothetical protein
LGAERETRRARSGSLQGSLDALCGISLHDGCGPPLCPLGARGTPTHSRRPDDWHTVALAMTTKTAIWTLDQKHFFGCGMTVWNMKVLRSVLADNDTAR